VEAPSTCLSCTL